MRDWSIFKKLLFYLILACLMTALLSVVIYSFTGGEIYARRIADELVPRARGMSRLASRYQTGQISFDSFLDFSLKEQQGCRVYIFDSEGELLAFTSVEKGEPQDRSVMQAFASEVLQSGRTELSTAWRSKLGIAVGVPIMDNMQRVTGAIVMTKPASEVYAAMRSLWLAMLAGSAAVSILMIVPAYFVSKRISDPIRRMTEASIAMAGGNFSVRADTGSSDEIGQLGSALNHLSAQLAGKLRDLELARNRLNTILDGIHEGVVALDAMGEIIYSNPAALSLFGCDMLSALSEKLAFAAGTLREVTADGKRRSLLAAEGERKLQLVVSVSQETNEVAPGTIVVVQDVTASERLEQTRRDYVANVSHELRTPIASIRSVAETLNDGLIQSDEDRSRYYGYILRESMRLSRLINDLLELSRLQSGTVALEKTPFDLAPLINEVAERMRMTASYSGLDVQVDQKKLETPAVFSNRDRIEQVLIALVDNAIKYASDDGEVCIAAEEGAQCAIVSVKNTGAIGEKDLPHLFERFYKADASHSAGGTGLGLAIVQEVLTQLGETIEACNEDGFAVFRFTLHRPYPPETQGK